MTGGVEATMRLLLDRELSSGEIAPVALSAGERALASTIREVPPRPLRVVEQVRYKLGELDFESSVRKPLVRARRAALGDRAAAPPRFLVRVDEFPHYQAWDDPGSFGTGGFERFHAIMAGAGVAYLVAVLPRVSRSPLDPEAGASRALEEGELAVLRRMSDERVAFGLHGRDHRTRFSSPRRHSELCGLSLPATESLISEALAELAPHGIHPEVFVAPYNRFDAPQYPILAEHFEVVCGGPESIGTMGFHSTPQWRGEAVYLPSYAPLYGRAAEVLPAVERAIAAATGLWEPVVLHWGWEMQDGWGPLERLAERIAPYAADWGELHAAIQRARTPAGAGV